jgi:hypothetical protein
VHALTAAAFFTWQSIIGGLIVALTSGLILEAIRRWLNRRDEKRKQARQETRDRHTARSALRVGGDLVARELEANAAVSERVLNEVVSVPEEVRRIGLQEFTGRKTELAALRDEAPTLWDELCSTYDELARVKDRGDYPPPADALRGLASRVRQATAS